MYDITPFPNLSIIVACAQNMAIGKDNDLLWHISADLKRFKSLTSGHTVVMGRRTFDSLPKKPLPKRRNIVLTHDHEFQYDVPPTATGTLEVAHSIPQVLKMVQGEEETFVMGGGALYREFLPLVNNLYVTWVYEDFDADVFFPVIDSSVFRQVSLSERQLDEETGLWFAYADYVRIPEGRLKI
ncbi:MAG: dihydrofolate reductase [Bacteroidales bacterium]|nr:dihydrofolate reductase [Bacteroidales bacterium]